MSTAQPDRPALRAALVLVLVLNGLCMVAIAARLAAMQQAQAGVALAQQTREHLEAN